MTDGSHAIRQQGSDSQRESGPWDAAFDQLVEWDSEWAETCARMSTDPYVSGVLPRKLVELIGVALGAACTNLDPNGTRHHIRAALAAGATKEEILLMLKCASVLSIHSCSFAIPMLLEEAKAAGVAPRHRSSKPATPACDKMRTAGQWNPAWDPMYELDPVWTDEFMAVGIDIYASGMPPKDLELVSIALDASFTHMYAPGTRRHIKGALRAGATVEEILEVLKLCVAHGVTACNLGVPILAEELARHAEQRP